MLRSGGGLCLAGIGDNSLPRISPRIRALQDRLLDSLPADGAWECLSPAQRDAIISLHTSRLTGSPDGFSISPADAKWKTKQKGLNQFNRSRSYEDKLESETDDSGVRLVSGGTNSSTSISLEDDSSDPGIKKSGRFTKSAAADRFAKKDKPYPDISKKKGVANGIGNVNKILAKQLNKTGGPPPSKVTLDCRNLQPDRSRARIDRNNPFEQAQRPSIPNSKQISRRNILQRYETNLIRHDHKNSYSSEDYDGTSIENSQHPEIQIRSSHMDRFSEMNKAATLDDKYRSRHRAEKLKDSKSSPSAKLNVFDYRNALNQDSTNKYSSNWNNMILSEKVPIKPSPKLRTDLRSRQGAPPSRKLNDHRQPIPASNPERNTKKYIRSKSLDRKYLDDSSDDDTDFENRRRVERMKRYAKANADWELQRDFQEQEKMWGSNGKLQSGSGRSRSAWDLTRMQRDRDDFFDEPEHSTVFRSRKTIINKWKSEENELDARPKQTKQKVTGQEFSRKRWQRHSCDFDLELSEPEFQGNFRRHAAQKHLHRSTEDHLDLDADDVFDFSSHDDWEDSVEGEMKIIQKRRERNSDSSMPYIPPRHNRYPINHQVEPPPRRRSKESRKLSPQLDQNPKKMAAGMVRPRPALSPYVKQQKTHQGFRGKLRLFKSILSL